MTESKRTLAEYKAAAMLLGRWYDEGDHTFTKFGTSVTIATEDYMIDADTLEVITPADYEKRVYGTWRPAKRP